ncbi:MAG: FAD-dependent oxidoreductase [bacterium]|nr:FAD-dependent oxidoreductase [bacterium]
MKRLSIIGAGVIGLSTGILAQEKGYAVTLYTADDPLHTTSIKSAASFKPSEVVYNELAHAIIFPSFERFSQIQKTGRSSGVWMHTLWEAFSNTRKKEKYLSVMRDVEVIQYPRVVGGYKHAWKYKTFFIDTSAYIPWLINLFSANGGTIEKLRHPFSTMSQLSKLPSDSIINCTGYGAKKLCRDELIVPIKGQIIVIGKLKQRWSINADGFYIYPRTHDTIVGGTYEWGVENETVEGGATYLIQKGNMRIVPSITKRKILRVYAGIRPYRKRTIRIEKEDIGGKRIIHQYGHGGAGVTLSWGSAEYALSLI